MSPWLPYARPSVADADVRAVEAVLRSDWLTTGPNVEAFEKALARRARAAHAVAYANGTAALHGALAALNVGPGDEVLVPAITFVASANAALYVGARPVPVDIEPGTLLIDLEDAERKVTSRTKALMTVDYAGLPVDYDGAKRLARAHGLRHVSDACHSLGASFAREPVGSQADVTVFSFHPVKPITTGEGGAALTQDPSLAQRLRRFRSHGIDSDHRAREAAGSWAYDMVELGYNYRLNDIQCALGVSQLGRLDEMREKRAAIATRYDQAFADSDVVRPLSRPRGREHAHHLYVVRIEREWSAATRDEVFTRLRAAGIGANVHYKPFHLHSYYLREHGTHLGMCPAAEQAYGEIISLPLHADMENSDVDRVVEIVRRVTGPLAASSSTATE